MQNENTDLPHPLLITSLNESVPWFWETEVTADEMANQSRFNRSQGFCKVLAAWIAASHRRIQVQMFGRLLVPLESLTELVWYLLRWIITRDKTWIHYDDLESKCHIIKCRHLLSQILRKFKMHPTVRKCCWLIFWVSSLKGRSSQELLISVVCCMTVWSQTFLSKHCTNCDQYIVNVFWPTHI
jgi:hypothetical protein